MPAWHAVVRGVVAVARASAVMSSTRTIPSPAKVGTKTLVFRGIGKPANADAGTPESVYSVYISPLGSCTL